MTVIYQKIEISLISKTSLYKLDNNVVQRERGKPPHLTPNQLLDFK